MFDPNEDIEDLYRRAADRFDLESSGPDWKRMSKALDQLSTPSAGSSGGINRFTGLRRFVSAGSRMLPAGLTAVVFAAGIFLVYKKTYAPAAQQTTVRAAAASDRQPAQPSGRTYAAGAEANGGGTNEAGANGAGVNSTASNRAGAKGAEVSGAGGSISEANGTGMNGANVTPPEQTNWKTYP